MVDTLHIPEVDGMIFYTEVSDVQTDPQPEGSPLFQALAELSGTDVSTARFNPFATLLEAIANQSDFILPDGARVMSDRIKHAEGRAADLLWRGECSGVPSQVTFLTTSGILAQDDGQTGKNYPVFPTVPISALIQYFHGEEVTDLPIEGARVVDWVTSMPYHRVYALHSQRPDTTLKNPFLGILARDDQGLISQYAAAVEQRTGERIWFQLPGTGAINTGKGFSPIQFGTPYTGMESSNERLIRPFEDESEHSIFKHRALFTVRR